MRVQVPQESPFSPLKFLFSRLTGSYLGTSGANTGDGNGSYSTGGNLDTGCTKYFKCCLFATLSVFFSVLLFVQEAICRYPAYLSPLLLFSSFLLPWFLLSMSLYTCSQLYVIIFVFIHLFNQSLLVYKLIYRCLKARNLPRSWKLCTRHYLQGWT